jgi:hypothetical protein
MTQVQERCGLSHAGAWDEQDAGKNGQKYPSIK